MANSFVQVAPNSTGSKLQTVQNVVSGLAVDAQAVTLVDGFGTLNPTIATNPVSLGGVAVAALPAGAYGTAAVPVYANARRLHTYAVAVNALSSGALVAATSKNLFTIYHPITATKTVRLRRILLSGYVSVASAAAVATLEWRLFRGVAAPSVNGTVITPSPTNAASGAPEAIVQTLGTIAAATLAYGPVLTNASPATGLAVGSVVPFTTFYDWQEGGETEALTLRAGILESLVLSVQSTSTPTVIVHGNVIFTEE